VYPVALDNIIDLRLRDILATAYEEFHQAEQNMRKADTDTETYIDNIYVSLMTDMIALSFAGIIKINEIPRRQISRADVFKGQVLKQYYPKFIRDRIRSRTKQILTPTKTDYITIDKVAGQSASVMCIWHNLMLACLRMDDQSFPKIKGGLQDASTIPLKAMMSVNKWIKDIWSLRNS
jgi:hypothetical protein